jgi:hypothetical protein
MIIIERFDRMTGHARWCRLRPPTVRFYFNCRHHAALPQSDLRASHSWGVIQPIEMTRFHFRLGSLVQNERRCFEAA